MCFNYMYNAYIAGYSVTSINMRNGDEYSTVDDTLRYFSGSPKYDWKGKVLKHTLISYTQQAYF